MIETKKSFCRFCHVFCGVEVDVEDGRVVAVRGDRDNEVSRGYTCPKGRAETERIHHPDRLSAPERRDGDGWTRLGKAQALDEVAERIGDIVARGEPLFEIHSQSQTQLDFAREYAERTPRIHRFGY